MAVEQAPALSTVDNDNPERITIRGIRVTFGDAVECPQVRTIDGKVYSVSYLSPEIDLDDLVEVTGFMANMTTCRGPVLYAEEVRKLEH